MIFKTPFDLQNKLINASSVLNHRRRCFIKCSKSFLPRTYRCFLVFRNFVRFRNSEQFSNWQYLFVTHGILNAATKWLCSSETWWARQTVVPRFSILTPVHSVEHKAGIRNLFALKLSLRTTVSIIKHWFCPPFPFSFVPFQGENYCLLTSSMSWQWIPSPW